MAPIKSYPFMPMDVPESRYQGNPCTHMYPVVGKAVGITIKEQYDIVVRDNRYRMNDTLLPDDVKERVAAGDTAWDRFRLTFS